VTTRPLTTAIEPLTPARWRLGIFDSTTSPFPRIEDEARLGNGISYQPFDNNITDDPGFDPCATDIDVTPDEADVADEKQWQAWKLAFAKSCSTLTGGAEEALAMVEAKARAQAEARSSYHGEKIFWTGDINAGDSFSGQSWANRPLASASATSLNSGAATGLVQAFGLIHEYLADTLDGLRGVIHVPPILLPYLAFYGIAVRDGFTLGTALGDHLVAAGSGYQGTSPAGAAPAAGTAWIYATSMIRVGQTAIRVISDIDRTNNKAIAIAERAQVAEWDLAAHAAALICLPDPGPDCP